LFKYYLATFFGHVTVRSLAVASPLRGAPAPRSLALLELYLHIDAGRQIELHQLVDGLVGRIDDVHKPQMRAYLELVARVLVHMRRAQDVEPLDLGRQRHRTLDDGARPLRGLDDFLRRLVDQLVVERLQADADSLVLHLNSRLTAASALLEHFGHDAGADGAAAFANRKTQALFHRNRRNQGHRH